MVEWKRQPVTAPDAKKKKNRKNDKKNKIKNRKNCGNGPGLRGTNTFRLGSFCFQTETQTGGGDGGLKKNTFDMKRRWPTVSWPTRSSSSWSWLRKSEYERSWMQIFCHRYTYSRKVLTAGKIAPTFRRDFIWIYRQSWHNSLFSSFIFFPSSWLAKQKIFARYVKFMLLALLGHTIWHYFYCGFI